MTARRGNQGAPERASAIDSIDPPRNFTITTEERVRALSIGAPAYAERKRRIEDAEASFTRILVKLADELRRAGKRDDAVLAALREKAERFDFARVNALVERHNRYYPMEANLPMDRDGSYLLFGKPFEKERPFDVARVVATALRAIAERDREDADDARA